MSNENKARREILQTAFNTLNGVFTYASAYGYPTVDSFIDFLGQKTISDSGSGYGGLAISARLLDLPCSIYGTNVQFGCRSFLQEQAVIVRAQANNLVDRPVSQEELVVAIDQANKRTVDQFAHETLFPDNFFDDGFDLNGPYLYIPLNGKELFYKTIANYYRTLKRGGSYSIFTTTADREGIGSEKLAMLEQFGAEVGFRGKRILDEQNKLLGYKLIK